MLVGSTEAGRVLVGRGSQRRSLDDLLAAAREGRSGSLVIHGDAGAGKTALVEYARASAVGFLQLHATGFTSDTDLPFSGLAQVVRPLEHLLPSIPLSQRRAVESALALAAPSPVDRFAASTGTLSLLAAAAEERPLLVTVDDLQWIDRSSLDALVFVARRLHAEGVAVVFALRDGDGQVPVGLTDLRVEGLEPHDAVALLRRRSAGAIHPDVAREIVEITRGYPLPLIELATQLRPEQLRGIESLPEPLPAGKSMEDWYRGQVATLPPETQRALLVLATLDSLTPWLLNAVLQRRHLDRSALDPATRAGLLRVEGDVPTLRHPLIRSAIYHLDDAERRAIHAAIADALPESERERRAWHRAQSTVGPSERLAAELEDVARHATLRNGAPGAARALERAAELSEDAAARDRRLYEAAYAWQQAGRWQRALALIDELGTADAGLFARVEYLRGQIELWSGSSARAVQRLVDTARRVERADPAAAVAMLCEAAAGATMQAALDRAVDIGKEALRIATALGADVHAIAAVGLAHACLFKGEFARTRELIPGAETALRLFPHLTPALAPSLVFALLNLDEFERARAVSDRVIARSREQNAPSLLPFMLAVQCELDFRTGRWNNSLAAGSEAVSLAEDLGQNSQLSYALVSLARVEAAMGAEAECRGHLEGAMACAERFGLRSIEHYVAAATGFLELGLMHTSAAADALRHAATLRVEAGLEAPSVLLSLADFVEVLARDDEPDAALEALSVLETQAAKTGSRWAIGCAARCRGILSRDAAYEDCFERSIALLGPMPFEEARTLLCYGEKLRSTRRRRQAAERLHAALATFERLGAEPWSHRARFGLEQLGERRPLVRGPVARILTRQELQVSLMVSEGLTNQEVADRLFLSHKTVETHLSNAYRKLAVGSRVELARLLIKEALAPPPTN